MFAIFPQVDVEVNGEPLGVYMKLGESGEAFFVEELEDDEDNDIPEHLATSPIPVSEIENIFKTQVLLGNVQQQNVRMALPGNGHFRAADAVSISRRSSWISTRQIRTRKDGTRPTISWPIAGLIWKGIFSNDR